MHLVQPMQSASTISATTGGFTAPLSAFSGLGIAAEQFGQRAHAGFAAGRALVDVGFAGRQSPSAYGRQPG